jgi:hypothetical protein
VAGGGEDEFQNGKSSPLSSSGSGFVKWMITSIGGTKGDAVLNEGDD